MTSDSTSAGAPVVSVRAASLGYRTGTVLTLDTLDVYAGTMVGVLGTSGSGKSTLLAALARRPVVRTGSVTYPGATRVGFVPQLAAATFDPLCVAETVALGAPRRGLGTRSTERRRVAVLLERLGLADLGRRRLDELSGGERQRVAIARALFREPALLLCDEPTSGADPALATEIVDVLADLAAAGTAVVVATHDLAIVAPRMDRLLAVAAGTVVEHVGGSIDATMFDSVYGVRPTRGGGR